MIDSDPPEMIGRDSGVRADPPKSKRTAAPVVLSSPAVRPTLAEELASPVPPVSKPGSHPKHAIARPRREWELAKQEVADAQAELRSANDAFREADIAESNALEHWLSLQPKVDPDQLLRDYAVNSTAQRAANVAAGLPPEGVRRRTHGNSPIDVVAANRPRTSPQASNSPLRSPIHRRSV